MITFISVPKPFRGHIRIIQRNAIESWKRVHPAARVILFGDEEGIAEAARDLAVQHISCVKRNQHGTPFLAPILDAAHDLSSDSCLCYINGDIILLSDFRAAAERVLATAGRFLMAGQRWDTDITAPVDFSASDSEATLRRKALDVNHQRPPQWIDYFVFSRGLYYGHTPPLVIGRPGFDNWMVWYARHSGARVIDATAVVQAIHQNHDYSHHPGGAAGVSFGDEAKQNYVFLKSGRCFATVENATHQLTVDGLRPNYRHWRVLANRRAKAFGSAVWFGILNLTRPLRHRLGLRSRNVSESTAGSK